MMMQFLLKVDGLLSTPLPKTRGKRVVDMSNAEAHALAGFFVGAFGYAIVKHIQGEEINPVYAFGWGVVGAGVALLPDVIEPSSIGPAHRAVAHSVVTAGLVTYTAKKAWENPYLTGDQKAAATAMGAAFLSHLMLDATTPAGLPIL